jgi:hypothetical protein
MKTLIKQCSVLLALAMCIGIANAQPLSTSDPTTVTQKPIMLAAAGIGGVVGTPVATIPGSHVVSGPVKGGVVGTPVKGGIGTPGGKPGHVFGGGGGVSGGHKNFHSFGHKFWR